MEKIYTFISLWWISSGRRLKNKSIAVVFCCSIVAFSNSQTNVWTGSIDNDWHKTCNWSLSLIPGCTHDVVIPNTTNKPNISGIAHSGTVEIQSSSGAELNIESLGSGVLYIGSANGGVCSGTPTNNSSGCGGSALLNYTGGVQTWQVPSGITSVTVDAWGAQGGSNAYGSTGGLGGHVSAVISVTPGEVLSIYVGGAGSVGYVAGGYNGGGYSSYYNYTGSGGGASDVRNSGGTKLIVAGGGGGAGFNCSSTQEWGGAGGSSTGGSGYQCNQQCCYVGTGGTQSSGGLAGNNQGQGCGTNGSAGQGGDGACNYGGGGGGGYYGGGGGGYGGGGGGSNYTSGSVIYNSAGVRSGHGLVTIAW